MDGQAGAIGAGQCEVGCLLACECRGGQRHFHKAQGLGDHGGSVLLPVLHLFFEVGQAQAQLFGHTGGRYRRGAGDGLIP